jgi:antitoxin component of MazEF toxin-antitoxin module
MMKSVYAVNLHRVGNPKGKSHVFVLPSAIVKDFGFTVDTIFALRVSPEGTITLEPITATSRQSEADTRR